MREKMIPIVKANGADIPVLGFGTWPLSGAAAVAAVGSALDAGYRHIDTAAMYGNEAEVGEAIRTHATPRDEIFVTTKVWPSDVADGPLQRSAEASLKRLGLDQVDLLLIHWPSREVPFAEQIRALCDARRRGFARHIGVSNFPPRYVEAAVRLADEPIVADQVEHHPHLDQRALFATCAKHGIAVTSYAPLGRGALLNEPAVREIANAHGKSPAQIVLRWHVQQPTNVAIPKSGDPRRIAENIAIFDFALSAEEMRRISSLARPNTRVVRSALLPDNDAEPQ
jgi:diketogulonate reductase-like aldo/keto reductase